MLHGTTAVEYQRDTLSLGFSLIPPAEYNRRETYMHHPVLVQPHLRHSSLVVLLVGKCFGPIEFVRKSIYTE